MAGQFRIDGLKQRRERQEFTVQELAHQSAVAVETIQRLETQTGACLRFQALAILRVLSDDMKARKKLKGLAGELGLTLVEV